MAQACPKLDVERIQVRGVRVPVRFVLGTSAASVSAVPLVLVDLRTTGGAVGRAYSFSYTPSGAKAVAAHLAEACEVIAGQLATPFEISERLARRYRLIGVTGTVRMALSTLDCALWDAAAVEAGVPLCEYLGGSRQSIAAYDSRGLGLMAPAQLSREVEALRRGGLATIKLRLGYPTLQEDIAALRAAKAGAGGDVAFMVDYNQALDVDEALERGKALQPEGVVWLEEPIRHDDYAGAARIARALDVPVQIGENFNGSFQMQQAIDAGACDLVMPDVARIGGVTGWMESARLAERHDLKLSSHLMPEQSIHLLAASPTPHFVEWVDWAEAFLSEPLVIDEGRITPPNRPGFGMSWDEARLSRLEQL